MKLKNYKPTFRHVLLVEVTQEQEANASGLWLPPTADDKGWKVVKTGSECITIIEGDMVNLMRGIYPQEVKLDGSTYGLVVEQQIVGYERQ